MKLQRLSRLFRISSKKFYQIVEEKRDQLIPSSPEELILSKYLKGDKQFMKITKDGFNKSLQKNKGVNYQAILENNPFGSIIEQTYKEHTLNLVSLDFRNVELKSIMEMCSQFEPDLILVQSSPQSYLPHFQLFPKHEQVFSDSLYLHQLLVSHSQLQSFLTKDVYEYLDVLSKGEKSNKKVMIPETKGLIEDDVLFAACYSAKKGKASVMLGQMPLQPYREWLLNSHTLMEIQQLFKSVCKNWPFYQTLQLSLERLACLTKPSLFLNVRDRYIATLLQMAISTGKFPKILAILGALENQAILQLLQSDQLLNSQTEEYTPMIEYLVGPPTKSTILRNVTGWQIIQKHIILDVMKHGENILNTPIEELQLTSKVSDHYGMLINSYQEEQIMKFRYEKIMEYLSLMKAQFEEGRQLKKKFMLREAIRKTQDVV